MSLLVTRLILTLALSTVFAFALRKVWTRNVDITPWLNVLANRIPERSEPFVFDLTSQNIGLARLRACLKSAF